MENMDVPNNETPEQVKTILETLLGYLSAYGWQLLFFVLVINVIYTQFGPKLQKWLDKRSDEQLAAEYLKDPDKLINMQEAMVLSRLQMQEEYDKSASEYAEKMKQREEEKRRENIKQFECIQTGSSYSEASKSTEVTGVKKKQDSKQLLETSFRGQSYNPLTGSSSRSCYRPSRRGRSSGG